MLLVYKKDKFTKFIWNGEKASADLKKLAWFL